MDRKEFIAKSGIAGSVLLLSGFRASMSSKDKVRFGVISDLHQDIMHDGVERLSAFIGEMNAKEPDFIIQLGDFCIPKPENRPLMEVWNSFKGPRYHVIGNHDNDGGYTRDQVVDFWNAEAKYYSFDTKGYHFIILDGNEHNDSESRPVGYARFISEKQLEWLKQDLSNTTLPTVVFCHQGMDNDAGGLENGTLLRYTLEQAKRNNGKQKVILVLSGHHHQDYHNQINGIHYVQINSASYQWVGEEFTEIRYSAEVDKAKPLIKYTVPYRDPLWAMIEIDGQGKISVKGKKTVFVGSSPEELGVSQLDYIYPIVPFISDRKI